MRADSIRSNSLEDHVNSYLEDRGSPYRYSDLSNWLDNGEYGEAIPLERIRRRLATPPPAQSTFYKWLAIYNENKKGLNN